MNRKPRVYFAGKIGKNDWREGIFGSRAGAVEEFAEDAVVVLHRPDYEEEHDDFIYCGPFFISCDHGCAHGPNKHGVNAANPLEKVPNACFPASLHKQVFDINLLRLRRANLVFAYIDSADAYGTLLELGVAVERKIPIGLRLPDPYSPRNDLWMAREAATAIYEGSPRECWDAFAARFLTAPPEVVAKYLGHVSTANQQNTQR